MNKEDLKQEEKLVAVMLLDTYSENFCPLSLKKAECLLPLLGAKTQLDTNIEYLINNKVEEIYLFATYHHSQIRGHLSENSEERLKLWRSQGCEVHFLYNFKCQSVGDAMREIDAKGLVRSNFILITTSTVISNIKLDDYLNTHKAVSKQDKNCVMTLICQDRTNDLAFNSSLNETQFSSQASTVIIHNNNNRVLHYDQVKLNPLDRTANKYIQLPAEMFQNAYRTASKQSVPTNSNSGQHFSDIGVQSSSRQVHMKSIEHLKTIQQRNDLVESGVYLCSPYVLHMFTDNFDYENMTDYIRGVLVEEEVAGYTCYIDVFKKKFHDHYSNITNINTYYLEMMKMIQRNDLILNEKERALYHLMADCLNVHISRSNFKSGQNLKIEKNCFIEANCSVGSNCHLVNCYIGANCVIGDGVTLANCIILPNTHVGNKTNMNAVLVGFNVNIGNECSICENCLISNDCHVKDKTKITERGIYVRKEESKAKAVSTKPTDLSVTEDNYCKYFLNSKGLNEDSDNDDDFGSIEGDINSDDEDDASSTNSAGAEANDSSKNYHFYICKIRSKKANIQNRLRRSNSNDSISSHTSYGSRLSAISSDEFDQDTEEEETYEDFDNDENQAIGKANNQQLNKLTDEDHVTFLNETTEILKRGLKNNLNPDNLILEINSCKHANNIQIDDLCYFLTKALLNLPVVLNNQATYLKTFKSYIQDLLKDLLVNYYTKTKKSQKIFLDATLDYFVEIKSADSLSILDADYVRIIHFLYNDVEVLDEDVVIEWYEEKVEKLENPDCKDPGSLVMIKKLEGFIEWLREESSEEESDEDNEQDD